MQKLTKTIAAVVFAALTLSQAQVPAADEAQAVDSRETPVEIFVPPKSKKLKAPTYPREEVLKNGEGWVNLHMMVDPRGKPYEIAVTRSTGSKKFEREALRVAKKWIFEPAQMNGQPIDAGTSRKIKFSLAGGTSGAKRKFVWSYKKLMKSVDGNERTRADEQLASMTVTNLYEDAYFNLARYHYATRWGSEDERKTALRLSIAHESDAAYLPEKLFSWALAELFLLEVQTQDFGSALLTWGKLKSRELEKEMIGKFMETVENIHTLREDDRRYTVSGSMGDATSWHYHLLKDQFSIKVSTGELAELKLRCDKKYVGFRYDPEKLYRISDQYGRCLLEVVGNPGSTFKLTQS